jgi:diguanylate cyclase (GGDEF)-like protein
VQSRAASKPAEGKAASPQPTRQELIRQIEALQAENARLREQSLIDTLTGLHNFRYFQEQLDIEMERVRRTAAPCALLMADIDFFKRVNDTYGHEAGNTVLRETASVIKASVRAMDIACRYGGEEFAVILPSTTLDGAVRIGERIRKALKRRTIEHPPVQMSVTISVGAACLHYLEDLSRAQFIELSDSALYKAKRAGRDQVCGASAQAPATEVTPAEKGLLK